jgi:hypothetical protein
VASYQPGGKFLSVGYDGIKEYSAGHSKHEYATGYAFKYIFDDIENNIKKLPSN